MADAPPQKKSKLSDEKFEKNDLVESLKKQRSKVSSLQKLCLFQRATLNTTKQLFFSR